MMSWLLVQCGCWDQKNIWRGMKMVGFVVGIANSRLEYRNRIIINTMKITLKSVCFFVFSRVRLPPTEEIIIIINSDSYNIHHTRHMKAKCQRK